MLREAEWNDLDGMLDLFLHLHESQLPQKDIHLLQTWKTIMEDPNHHLIVYEIDGKIISSCTCIIVPNLTRSVRPYAFVENVVTHAQYRNKGYAGQCIEYALQIAKRENCYKVMLLTGSKEPATLRFYQKHGFNCTDKTAFVQWLD